MHATEVQTPNVPSLVPGVLEGERMSSKELLPLAFAYLLTAALNDVRTLVKVGGLHLFFWLLLPSPYPSFCVSSYSASNSIHEMPGSSPLG